MADQAQITNIDFKRFEAAFKTSDDVGAVVRCEFEIERAAYRALKVLIPKYDLFKHRYLSEHLKTFRAFGCSGALFQVADYVRKIRNEFAHDGISLLTDKHVKELNSQAGNCFGNRPLDDWTIIAGTWEVAVDTRYSSFCNRQRFVLASALTAASIDTIPQRIPRLIHLDHLP